MLDKNGDKPFKYVHETLWVRLVRSPLFLTVGCLKLRLSGCENLFYKASCSRKTEYSSLFFVHKRNKQQWLYWGICPRPQTAAAKHIWAPSWRAAVTRWYIKSQKVVLFKATILGIYRVMSKLEELWLKEIEIVTKNKIAARSVRLL